MIDETPPTSTTQASQTREQQRQAVPGIVPSHGISISLDAATPDHPHAPPLPVRHVSAPAYQSPIRHHRRAPSRSKGVKETLNARSHYGSSDDDGGGIHRINQYIIKQEIGRGSFGAVHLAVDQYDNEYAVKEFSKSRLRKRAQSNLLRQPNRARPSAHLSAGQGFNSPLHRLSSSDKLNGDKNNSLDLIKEEIAIMKKLDHHNLVSLIEVLDDPQEDSLYMVLEMCKKGVVMKVGLDERADPYDDEVCRCWFRDMILGIEYLHAQGIIHRDIKPDNCLITHDDVLKIVDFGVSEMFEKESEMHTTKSAGSPAFMPPELCVVRHGAVSGKAADIWSMGVTLYCLRYGSIPFEKANLLELYESIKNDEPVLESEQDANFKDLMCRLLEKNPDKRITMGELREHPWVTRDKTDPMMPAEDNCASLVEPPTDAELQQAITGNMAHLMVVMKAVKRFKKLLAQKRPQFMEGIFGRDSRIVAPPHSIHGQSKSVDAHNRYPIESALVAEGIHRDMDEDIKKTSAELDRLRVQSPDEMDIDSTSTSHQEASDSQQPPSVSETLHPGHAPTRARTFPIDDHGKGHAHDPLEDKLYLAIGSGADVAESGEAMDEHMVCESPGGVDDDIYELAYQEEIKRILAEREGADLHLTRRVEHIERLRRHPNMLSSSLNYAMDFAGTTARRVGDRAKSGGLAALVRDARDRARQTVAEAEQSQNSPSVSPLPEGDQDGDPASKNTNKSGLDVPTSGSASRQASQSPRPDTVRLRDYARASASQALRGMAKRIDDTASKLDRSPQQTYEGT